MKRTKALIPTVLLAGLPSVGQACSVCFGAPGSKETTAIGWSILFLMGVVVLVLGCIAAFGIRLAVRAARYPRPEDAGLAEALDTRVP